MRPRRAGKNFKVSIALPLVLMERDVPQSAWKLLEDTHPTHQPRSPLYTPMCHPELSVGIRDAGMALWVYCFWQLGQTLHLTYVASAVAIS